MNESSGLGAALLGTLGATVVVAIVAWGALALLRRLGVGVGGAPHRGSGGARPRRRLRVIQSLPLGTRERAVLITDGEREYLLGVAAGGVRLLERRASGDTATDSETDRPLDRDVGPADDRTGTRTDDPEDDAERDPATDAKSANRTGGSSKPL